MTAEVRAAGGVVWRRRADTVEILAVHRPRYGDWSLPKGKAMAGEADADCAQREVEEETGLRCVLGDDIGTVRYADRHGNPKVVRYWTMQPVHGQHDNHGPASDDEVDEVRWLDAGQAGELLTYERDRHIVDRALRRLRWPA